MMTKTDEAQLTRWNQFLTGWKLAAKNKNMLLIGDINLDFLRWDNPDPTHEKMVSRTREVIESAGHIQVIKGHTRTWRGQADSLLDHCWLNMPNRLICTLNEKRGSSDHNVVTVIIRTKNRVFSAPEIQKRSWKKISEAGLKSVLCKIDWSSFFLTDNLDEKNSIFEQKVSSASE